MVFRFQALVATLFLFAVQTRAQDHDLSTLRATLKSGSLSQRLGAIQSLQDEADLFSLDALLSLITDPEERLRTPAAKAYLSIPKRYVDRIVARAQVVGHGSEEVKALWATYEKAMVRHQQYLLYGDYLERLLNDLPQPTRRRTLLEDLLAGTPEDTLYKPQETPYRDLCGEEAPPNFEAIRRVSQEDTPLVLGLLANPNYRHRRSLIRCLPDTMESRLQSALRRLLNDPVPVIRAEALSHLDGEKAGFAAKLLAAARDPYAVVREMAAYRAFYLPDAEENRLLLKLLQDPSPGVASAAAKNLALRQDVKVKHQIVGLLSSRRAVTVAAAAQAASESMDPFYVPALQKALTAGAQVARGDVAFALSRLLYGKPLIWLLPFLKDKDESVVKWAATGLGSSRDLKVIPALERVAAKYRGDTAFFARQSIEQIRREVGASR